MSEPRLKCVKCNKTFSLSPNKFCCPSPDHDKRFCSLFIEYPYNDISEFPTDKHTDKYIGLLPISQYKVTLGEGNTPLLRLSKYGDIVGLNNLWAKDEGRNPTGSFKDRKSVVDINKAIEWGITSVVNVTSGNAGISLSAYSSKVNIQVNNIVVGAANNLELSLIKAYGGIVTRIDKQNRGIVAVPKETKSLDCTCGKDPIGAEGYKLIAWEIWEEIGVPDIVVCPCGSGDALFGIYKGFKELQYLKLAARLPAMWCVQVRGSETVKAAIDSGSDSVILKKGKMNSVARHIVTRYTPALPLVVHAIQDSNGQVIIVSDNEIRNAFGQVLKSEAILQELTSASVFAAIKMMKSQVDKDAKVVCIISGNGLKEVPVVSEVATGILQK